MEELQPIGEEYIPFGTTYFEFHAEDPETAQEVYDEIRAKVKGTWRRETAILLDRTRGIVTVTRIRKVSRRDEEETNFYPFDRSLNPDHSNWALKQLIKDLRARFTDPVFKFYKSENVAPYYKFPNRSEAKKWIDDQRAAEIARVNALEFLIRTHRAER
jgi:hypothetical protein